MMRARIATLLAVLGATSLPFAAAGGCAGGTGTDASASLSPQEGVVYFLDDHLGNAHLVTDSLGNVLHEESRYPYGLERNSEGDAVKADYAFTGKEYDAETGLIYFGGRYYAPQLGRWITPDPFFLEKEPRKILEMPLELNLYGYVRNNPLNYIDPFGFKPGDIFGTSEAAAVDAIEYINPTSIRENREYGGWIKMRRDGTYTYKEPTKGTQNSIPNFPSPSRRANVWYHTHAKSDPRYGSGNETFSSPDKNVSNHYGKQGYLGTPTGQIKVYNPKTNRIRLIRSPDKAEVSK